MKRFSRYTCVWRVLSVATVLYVLQVPKPPVTLGTHDSSAFLQGTWP